uniref:Probable Vpr-like protein n=1 Tax=Brazilian caprine lentivirus TaxID=89592 RepID=Q9W9Z0_9RETR|nr:Tat [Brazilian caprine lentivirus]AAD24529.1 Tat [Brazilian caprine lentivirus]AAD24531.1 Tat [Brazilian caprine lentivirus]AAD24533.1 Tat [Brazilian caprine lentivirus]AAD24537.1 Tat [Brazilian caprine lentivirus]
MEEAPRRYPGGNRDADGIFQYYEEWECWDWVSQRVPGDILQRWLAMLTNSQLRRKVVKEMQRWIWRNPRAPIIRNCGCRLCNPGWGSEVRDVEL